MEKHASVKKGKKRPNATSRVVEAIAAYSGTLTSLSKKSGIPYPSLLEYSAGKTKPGLDALAAIVRVTGVSPVWLLTGEGDIRQHAESTKTLHVDGRLLARIATELELARIRVGELSMDAEKAVLEALPLNEKQYYALIAKELGIPPTSVKQRIDHAVDMATLVATIYNQIFDLTNEEKRTHRIREEAYGLLRFIRANRYAPALEPAQRQMGESPKHTRRRKV
jgi:transcriptional regulator with XRE-family HTH domain